GCLVVWPPRTLVHPRLGPSGASTSPRIWIRSINGRKFSVKRKTQNVVDVFVLRLFVVVRFPLGFHRFSTPALPLRHFFNISCRLAFHAAFSASYLICSSLSQFL